jgi:hypothetical protein
MSPEPSRVPFRFEGGFVAVSVFGFDLEGAVVEKFGGSFAVDLIAFLAAGPVKADRVARVFDFEAGLQGAEGDFADSRGDCQRRWAAEIEVSPVPEVASTIRQRPISRQFAGAFTPRPPAASATASDCKRRLRR